MYEPKGSFIDGSWVSSSRNQVELTNPATEVAIGYSSEASATDVDSAVRSAASTAHLWRMSTLAERVAVVERLQSLIANRSERLAAMQTAQMGAPIRASRRSMGIVDNLISSYLHAFRGIDVAYLRRDPWGQALVRRDPVGVVAAITPWNGPLPVAINKVVPAVLAGCTAVLKPAPETPLEASEFVELCVEAGLPPGVVNVVTGGQQTGEALVSHPLIDKVSFTGSTATGRRIATECAERFARTSLELGGKSAAIVLDDVNLDEAVPIIARGNFSNSGQTCMALSRVLVPRSRHDELVDALCAAARAHVVGDPTDEATTLGPLVSKRQLHRVLAHLDSAAADGATTATGGGRPPHLHRGYFVEPTVLVNVDQTMRIAREEVFGPVMSVIPYETVDEAVAIANDSEYGLHGAVFTTDLDQGLRVAERVRTGTIAVNGYSTSPSAPFGGVKASGIGREHGPEGIGAFLETKTFVLPPSLYETLARVGVPEG